MSNIAIAILKNSQYDSALKMILQSNKPIKHLQNLENVFQDYGFQFLAQAAK